jgi:hypothetical protein
MQKLIEKIEELIPQERQEEAVKIITNMLCDDALLTPLYEEDLLQALSIKGEFLVLTMSYEEFAQELIDEKLKYKISQSLSVVVSYEEDGNSFEDIQKFVHYIAALADNKQNATFGIKQVEQLSASPVTILFSGILPINQLSINISQDVHDLINSDEAYFKSRFEEFRDILSAEIGVPILPAFPKLDKSLAPTQVTLIDPVDGRLISKFSAYEDVSKATIESYLLKLFYIYISLAKKSA